MTFSPGGNTALSYPKDNAEIWKEFRKLWKRVNAPAIVTPVEYEVVWSFIGVLTTGASGVQSPRWPVPNDIKIVSFVTTISVLSPTGRLTVVVDIDGIDVATLANNPARNLNRHNTSLSVPAGSLVAVRWTAASSEIANVAVVARYIKVR